MRLLLTVFSTVQEHRVDLERLGWYLQPNHG